MVFLFRALFIFILDLYSKLDLYEVVSRVILEHLKITEKHQKWNYQTNLIRMLICKIQILLYFSVILDSRKPLKVLRKSIWILFDNFLNSLCFCPVQYHSMNSPHDLVFLDSKNDTHEDQYLIRFSAHNLWSNFHFRRKAGRIMTIMTPI